MEEQVREGKETIRKMLEDIKAKNMLVVVEGIKDRHALRELGITNVMTLTKPIFAVVEDIVGRVKEVVLLVDLDMEGKKLFHSLATDLQRYGVKVDNRLRELLFKTQLRHIEGLATYLADS